MTATLDTAPWTDFDVNPVTLGYHSAAINASLRVSNGLRVPFPTYNVTSLRREAESYEAHKQQAEKVMEVLITGLMDHIDVLRDMAELPGIDRKDFRECVEELITGEVFDADQYFTDMKEARD